jgi:hypothetical protein
MKEKTESSIIEEPIRDVASIDLSTVTFLISNDALMSLFSFEATTLES